MARKKLCICPIFVLVVAFYVDIVQSSAFSSFNMDTNWDTFQCANENPIVDEKTIILTATGLKWPKDLFCLALRKNLKVSGGYEISSQLVNVAPRSGERNIGFAFNVKDENTYDFAFLRYKSSDCTVVRYGYVDKGVFGTTKSELPCQKVSGNGWNFFKLSVDTNGDVDAYINGGFAGKFHSHFTARGFGGVLVANGFNNVAEFRNFDISPQLPDEVTNPAPATTQGTPPALNLRFTEEDIIAQASCVGLEGTTGMIYAVRRTCGTARTCNQICPSASLKKQDGQISSRTGTCRESLHVYGNRPNITGPEKLGPKVFRYQSCNQRGCGPNYCCCRFI